MQEKYKDRYRIQFCDKSFYSAHQMHFKTWKSRFSELSSVEKLQAWFVALCCLRRPADWFAGPRSEPLSASAAFKHSLKLGEVLGDTPILLPKKISAEINLFDFINHYRIKAVPESCFRSLVLMTDNTYPLIITEGVTEPQALLRLQLERKRLVALNENYEEWPHTLYSERDHLGFILHDLIHADHFFADPVHRDGQLGFYRFVEKLLPNTDLQLLLQNEKFKNGFEYIISDMNSHPLHLFQTLHSLLFQSIEHDERAAQIWQNWIQLGSPGAEALCYINSREFNAQMAAQVEALSQSMGRA